MPTFSILSTSDQIATNFSSISVRGAANLSSSLREKSGVGKAR